MAIHFMISDEVPISLHHCFAFLMMLENLRLLCLQMQWLVWYSFLVSFYFWFVLKSVNKNMLVKAFVYIFYRKLKQQTCLVLERK